MFKLTTDSCLQTQMCLGINNPNEQGAFTFERAPIRFSLHRFKLLNVTVISN